METDPSNPYAPPVSTVPEAASGSEVYVNASQGARFLNLIIDYLAFQVIMFGVGIGIGICYPHGVPLTQARLDLYLRLAGISLLLIYYLVMEALFGRTVGKFITGTKVIDLEGNPASFGKILGRTFCRLIPFDGFSFLGDGSGWHDTIPKTRVVKARKVRIVAPSVAPRVPGAAPVYRQPLPPTSRKEG